MLSDIDKSWRHCDWLQIGFIEFDGLGLLSLKLKCPKARCKVKRNFAQLILGDLYILTQPIN